MDKFATMKDSFCLTLFGPFSEGVVDVLMVVPGEDTEAGATLKVPQTEGLVIGRTKDPRVLGGVRVELNRSDVV